MPIKYPNNISPQLKDLFEKLFQKDPAQRIGSGPTGAAEIKSHPWFERVDWDAILHKKIKPPFIPKIKSETDTSCFDEEFVVQPIESVQEDSLKGKTYIDFSYGGQSLANENGMDLEEG